MSTFVTVAKDLFYAGAAVHQYQDEHHVGVPFLRHRQTLDEDSEQRMSANALASSAFVNAFRAICDGNSEFLILNHPHYFPYAVAYLHQLMWRCHLFRDELAFMLLSENSKKFYRN